MSKKPKPQWNYRLDKALEAIPINSSPYSEADFKRIESTIADEADLIDSNQYTPPSRFNLRKSVENAAKGYLGDKIFYYGPSRSESRAALQQLCKTADTLKEQLYSLDDNSWTIIETADLKVHQIQRDVSWLSQTVNEKLGWLKQNKGGKPPDTALKYFIAKLRWIYRDATGIKPSMLHDSTGRPCYTHFINFVAVCLKPIDQFQSDEALAKAIKRSLKKSSI